MRNANGINNEILAFINRRERQILVHSFIYYELNSNLITDETFDQWSKELVQLMNTHPKEFQMSEHFNEFEDFEGNTGMDLMYRSAWVVATATNLLETSRRESYW